MSKSIYHMHHIIPRHMGGSDDENNLVKLTIEEHALAHKELYEKYGKIEDHIAWRMLSGKTEEGEALRLELSKQKRKEYFDNPENMAKAVETGKRSRAKQIEMGESPETKKKRRDAVYKRLEEGTMPTWKTNISPEKNREYYKAKKEKMDQGRKNSPIWLDSVTNETYRKNKSEQLKGRVFSKEHLEKIAESNRNTIRVFKPFYIDDKCYISKADASLETGLSVNQITRRLRDEKHKNFYHIEIDELPEGMIWIHPSARRKS